MKYLVVSFFLLATPWLGSGESSATDVNPIEIREWTVPWPDTRPRDPYVDKEGRVWFVGQRGDYLAYLAPGSGEFRKYDLDPGTGPHNLIVSPSGEVWYAGNLAAHIGKLDPASGSISKIPMPDPRVRDPHTVVFDRNGDIWFTAQGANFVGKLTVATGEVKLLEVPTPRARPYGILVDEKNRPWFNEFGTNKLATVDPETMTIEEFELPRAEARDRRMALTSDGAFWYVDYAAGYLGRFDPRTREFREWPTPSGAESRPYAIAADDRDRIWLVETGTKPNRFVGFDPKKEEFFSSTEIKSGGGTVRHMYYDESAGAIWFGTDTNTIGRARIP